MLDYAKSSTHYSALGGVVFKSRIYEQIRYMDAIVALKTVLLNGLGPQIMKVC